MASKKYEFIISAKTQGFNSFSKATTGLNAFTRELKASKNASGELQKALSSITGKFSSLFAGLSLGIFTQSIWQAGTAMQGLHNSFVSLTGSSSAAATEINFVKQVANDLGIGFEKAIEEYRRLAAAAKGTALEGKSTRDIFIAISEASTALGLNADQTAGALNAISQMISKGKVSAEELRGQLGERLPGAFQIAADAMGVTTAELDNMISKGNLMANDFLPAFAKSLHDKFGNAAIEASNNAQAAFNRFQNAWFELKSGIAESGFLDLATGKLQELTVVMNNPACNRAMECS